MLKERNLIVALIVAILIAGIFAGLAIGLFISKEDNQNITNNNSSSNSNNTKNITTNKTTKNSSINKKNLNIEYCEYCGGPLKHYTFLDYDNETGEYIKCPSYGCPSCKTQRP